MTPKLTSVKMLLSQPWSLTENWSCGLNYCRIQRPFDWLINNIIKPGTSIWVPFWNSVWFCLACASCHISLLSVLIMVQITGLMKSGQIAQLVLRQAELCINAQNHRKWSSALGWGEFKDYLAPIPDTTADCSKIHPTHPLNTSRDCESTTSLGNLFHCLPTQFILI